MSGRDCLVNDFHLPLISSSAITISTLHSLYCNFNLTPRNFHNSLNAKPQQPEPNLTQPASKFNLKIQFSNCSQLYNKALTLRTTQKRLVCIRKEKILAVIKSHIVSTFEFDWTELTFSNEFLTSYISFVMFFLTWSITGV